MMALGLLFEGAVRALLLGLCIFVLLRLLRVRRPRQAWSVWVFALLASLLMVASMRTVPVSVVVELSPSVIQAVPRNVIGPAMRQGLFPVLGALYVAIAGLLCLRIVAGLVISSRIAGAAQTIDLAAFDVRVSTRLTAPVTFGRTVLVPVDFACWSGEAQRAVLAHEGAHVRWLDFHVQLLSQLHCALLWFSPFAWWLHAELRDLAERAADEAAIAAVGDKHRYAEILLDVAASRQGLTIVAA